MGTAAIGSRRARARQASGPPDRLFSRCRAHGRSPSLINLPCTRPGRASASYPRPPTKGTWSAWRRKRRPPAHSDLLVIGQKGRKGREDMLSGRSLPCKRLRSWRRWTLLRAVSSRPGSANSLRQPPGALATRREGEGHLAGSVESCPRTQSVPRLTGTNLPASGWNGRRADEHRSVSTRAGSRSLQAFCSVGRSFRPAQARPDDGVRRRTGRVCLIARRRQLEWRWRSKRRVEGAGSQRGSRPRRRGESTCQKELSWSARLPSVVIVE
jgi:hypothetical protein